MCYHENVHNKMVLHIRGCLRGKTRIGACFILGWLFDFRSHLHDDSLGHVISRYLKVNIMLIKYMCDSKLQKLHMRYLFQFYRQTNVIPKRVVVSRLIPLRDFVPEWNSRCGTTTGVNSRQGDLRRHDILWWYHVNKCRAMAGNWSELAPSRKWPRCHVNTP